MSWFKGTRPRTWGMVFICAAVVTSSVVASAWPLLGSKESILIVGIPKSEETVWKKSLDRAEVSYRYDDSKRTFFTRADPVGVLLAVRETKGISSTASRGLLERTIEKEFAREWPKVENPRVCLAFPNGIIADPDDSEPISIVMAKGLDSNDIAAARRFVADRVEGLPWKNVLILGTVSQPRPQDEQTNARYLLTKSEPR